MLVSFSATGQTIPPSRPLSPGITRLMSVFTSSLCVVGFGAVGSVLPTTLDRLFVTDNQLNKLFLPACLRKVKSVDTGWIN